MDFSDKIIAAIIAALVSAFISLGNRKAAKRDLEKKLDRGLTEKLYDLRLKYYGEAFKITDRIQRRPKPQGGIVSHDIIEEIRTALQEWKTGEVSLVISGNSLQAFRKLYDALGKTPGDSKRMRYSEQQIEKIFSYRDKFRKSLRADIGILFKEDF